MLNTQDYKKYKTDLRRRLTLPKYYLSKWDYFELNATNLEGIDLKEAQILYKTLAHLTEDERVFLANKYRATYSKNKNESPNYKIDKTAAKEHEMTVKAYRRLRTGVELKFFHYLQNYVDEHIIH